eukprot:6485508-Amphidinium_carterae.1
MSEWLRPLGGCVPRASAHVSKQTISSQRGSEHVSSGKNSTHMIFTHHCRARVVLNVGRAGVWAVGGL